MDKEAEVKGALDIKEPGLEKIAKMLEGDTARGERFVVMDKNKVPQETKDIVAEYIRVDTLLAANRHTPGLRLKGPKEPVKNIIDLELEKGLQEEMTKILSVRKERINSLGRELLFLYDCYQSQPGLEHMKRHAINFPEIITKEPKKTKGLRRS